MKPLHHQIRQHQDMELKIKGFFHLHHRVTDASLPQNEEELIDQKVKTTTTTEIGVKVVEGIDRAEVIVGAMKISEIAIITIHAPTTYSPIITTNDLI